MTELPLSVRVEMEATVLAKLSVAMMWPYGPVLWSDWEWQDLPSPSSQMWPTSKARRLDAPVAV